MRRNNIIKTIAVFTLFVLFFVLTGCQVCSASQCAYGTVYAWFKGSDSIWENATAHPVFRRGETFQIRIVVTTTTDLSVFFLKLHEFGTPVYEVLEGPTRGEQLLECRERIVSGQIFSYIWRMRVMVDTPWVNGYAPLEVFVQFNKNERDESRISFDVITAFISDEPLGNEPHISINETLSLPDADYTAPSPLGMGVFLITVTLVYAILRTKQKR